MMQINCFVGGESGGRNKETKIIRSSAIKTEAITKTGFLLVTPPSDIFELDK